MPTTREISRRRKRLDPTLVPVFFLLMGLTALLSRIVWTIPSEVPGLADEVARHLERSGVTSPVTAVLLNFRGYDTLLEVVVLFLSILGVWSLTKAPFPEHPWHISPVQLSLVRLLAPLMFLVASYLVWQGGHLAGGAFQGGAVFGGALVLMLVSDLGWLRFMPSLPLRAGLTVGPAVFLGVAMWCLIRGGELLHYPEQATGPLLLLVEAACAISIGLTLAGLFAGGRPHDDLPEEESPKSDTAMGGTG